MPACALAFILALFLLVQPAAGLASVTVSTAAQLTTALSNANSGGDKEILLQDGDYALSNTLHVMADGVAIRSASGNRSAVTIRGQGMQGGIGNGVYVEGHNFTLQDVTIGEVANHAVQLAVGYDNLHINNCVIRDTYEQMVKGPYDAGQMDVSCDNGLIENCYFYYTAGVGPQWYIGGVDVHNGHGWIIRDNIFQDIESPNSAVAEHAVHFWSSSSGTLVERNNIINCDRGVGFGLGERGHSGGIIRNNMIYHDAGGAFADAGISLENSPDTQVYNNTVYQEHSYSNAIEYRYSGTENVFIANNLTNKAIRSRDGGSGTVRNNYTDAAAVMFADAASGDLHLASAVAGVVNAGEEISGLTDDCDGDYRTDGQPDIGADEYGATSVIPAVTPIGTIVLMLLLAKSLQNRGAQ